MRYTALNYTQQIIADRKCHFFCFLKPVICMGYRPLGLGCLFPNSPFLLCKLRFFVFFLNLERKFIEWVTICFNVIPFEII